MNTTPLRIDEESLLARYLANKVRGRASGRLQTECHENFPHDSYFVGNLRPRPKADEHDSYLSELINKLAPTAFGAEFQLNPEANEIKIQVVLSWACYYRVFPTLAQQRSRLLKSEEEFDSSLPKQNTKLSTVETEYITVEDEDRVEIEKQQETENLRAEEDSPEILESALERKNNRKSHDSLFLRFVKITCEASGYIVLFRDVASSTGWSIDVTVLQNSLDVELEKARQSALNNPNRYRTSNTDSGHITLDEEHLADESAFSDFLSKFTCEVVPNWKWEIENEIRIEKSDRDTIVPKFEFVNATVPPSNNNSEPFLFDTEACFSLEGATFHPFEIELAPRGFRYDRTIWGRGHNCAIQRDPNFTNRLVTTHTPIYEQNRYETSSEPNAPFDALSEDPVTILARILSAMEDYRSEWDRAEIEYTERDPLWEQKHSEEFNNDRETYDSEIQSFKRGLQLVKQDTDVNFAFKLTNKTFRELGNNHNKPKTEWRLFQIVFIVSQIPGIVALRDSKDLDESEREKVDIVYFPTGGGKTEAYLGVIVFHCFFDRLRGKSAGVTAWTRFPLRLLTLQQTQRMADAIGIAELVRRKQTDPRLVSELVDPFSVGYLVGSEATPNEILNPQAYKFAQPKDTVLWSQANDSQKRQQWKRIVTCPNCRTDSVEVDFDAHTVRIVHRCTMPGCAFPEGEIPIFVVDNEIYRYLPSVIVGTIDKLAGLGNQRKFAQILGYVTGRCAIHGYYAKKCCQKDCEWNSERRRRSNLDHPAPSGLSGPTLFVQDELHLLKEGLGTFDGHYETFTQRLREEFSQNNTLKIIASSATIEAFERQVEHLYGRNRAVARRFPGPGPTLQDSFYAQTRRYPQRLYIGVLPHNKTIFNTILELIEFYHREIQLLQRLSSDSPNPYRGTYKPGTQAWNNMLDNYITSLTYFLATRELDGIHTDLEGDTNGRLRRENMYSLIIDELTGDTSTEEVTRILEKLERAGSIEQANSVLATSMVSHGVDIDRLNAMIFYGMPRQSAEYIQASSRVARSHVGLVFMCMHPARERDRSHYTYFNKYHEYLGQLVEPVAINRWATYSIDRTLPGLFMAVLLQLLAYRQDTVSPGKYYRREHVAKEINARRITTVDFVPLLKEAYQRYVQEGIDLDMLNQKIENQVDDFLYNKIAPAVTGFVSEALEPHKPMRSLRDVDETVKFELDRDGNEWTERINSSSS